VSIPYSIGKIKFKGQNDGAKKIFSTHCRFCRPLFDKVLETGPKYYLVEAEDFDAEFTLELREQEERLRARAAELANPTKG